MGRTNWDDEKSKKFLTILVAEKEKGCTKYSWPNICRMYNTQVDVHIDVRQAANHHNDMKKKFKAWEDLQGLSGIAYNPRTNKVDGEEQALERYENFRLKHSTYASSLVKKQLPNLDLMCKLFSGQNAHGVGGCFAPAMAQTKSYLSTDVDLAVVSDKGECVGDSEMDKNEYDTLFPSSAAESHFSSKSAVRKATRSTSSKRKLEKSIDSESKRRETSFDTVIELLKTTIVGSSSEPPSKAQRISDTLEAMGASEAISDEYFVAAIQCLNDEKYADTFLALRNDNQRWIYMKKVKIII